MMTLLFTLLLLAILFAWIGYRQTALYCFTFTILIASIVFFMDMTTPLNLQL